MILQFILGKAKKEQKQNIWLLLYIFWHFFLDKTMVFEPDSEPDSDSISKSISESISKSISESESEQGPVGPTLQRIFLGVNAMKTFLYNGVAGIILGYCTVKFWAFSWIVPVLAFSLYWWCQFTWAYIKKTGIR